MSRLLMVAASVIVLTGCGAGTSTVTVTSTASTGSQTRAAPSTVVSTSTSQPAATATTATTASTARPLSCPPGEVPNAEGVVCVRTATSTSPPACPGGKTFGDGECAPAYMTDPSACPSSRAYNSGQCAGGTPAGGNGQSYPSPNACIPKPAGDTDPNHDECPAGEITRGQAVRDQGCVGVADHGAIYWTPACDVGPVATYGLPCEDLIPVGGGYVAFYAGVRAATDVTGTNLWTPACLQAAGG